MHVLTISDAGAEATDYCWAKPGELSVPGFVCCRRDACGCSRAFGGIESGKSSTVLEVVDSPLTRDEVIALVTEAEIRWGWEYDDKSLYAAIADIMLEGAAQFAPGTLVRPQNRHGDTWGFKAL